MPPSDSRVCVATGSVATEPAATDRVAGGRVTDGSVAAAGEGFDGAVVVVVADGTVALVGAPAEFPPPTSGVTPLSTRAERLAAVGDGVFAGAAGVVTGTSCRPGFAEPLAGGPLVRLNTPPGVVGVVGTLRSAPEVRLESTAGRGPSTRPRVLVSDVERIPTGVGRAEAPFDSVVDATVPASAALARMREANALAAAIRSKN